MSSDVLGLVRQQTAVAARVVHAGTGVEPGKDMNGEMETCPLCNAILTEHAARDKDTEQLLSIFYCRTCHADWVPVGMDEWVAIEPLWPYNMQFVEVDE